MPAVPRAPARPARAPRAQATRSPGRGLVLWVTLGILGAGCDGRHDEALAELERLAFVPAGECVFRALSGPPLACSNERALLADAYEVRRHEWKAWLGAQGDRDPLLAAQVARWTNATDEHPASFMTQDEARRFAAARGMRLPTAREWLRIAAGAGRQPQSWPFGLDRESVANTLELDLPGAVAVGTFEQGKSSLSIYDLLGNVWEWVEEPVLRPYTSSVAGLEWAMGGSHLSKKRRLWEIVTVAETDPFSGERVDRQRWWFHAIELDPRARSSDVGLRCVADARAYLREHAGLAARGRSAEARLRSLGARWGPAAVPMLEELARESGASEAFGWLLAGARP